MPDNKDYADGARYVRSILGDASHRGAGIRTGVNFTTIGTMLRGGRADIGNTIKFARAHRINPNRLLRLFKYETIPEFDLIDWSAKPPLLVRETPGAAFYSTEEPGQPSDTVKLIVPLPPGEQMEVLTKDGRRIRFTEASFDPPAAQDDDGP